MARVPLFFMPSEKNMDESFAVSEIMLIFAPLKLQCGTSMPPSEVAFVVSAILEFYPIGAAASVIRKDLVA